MPTISKIKDKTNDIIYDIEDSEAREDISDLKSEIALNSGVPAEVKLAFDAIVQNIAFLNGEDYAGYKATIHAWATETNIVSISAVFAQGSNIIYDSDSLDYLKQYLTVTATYDNGTTSPVSAYTLSGELTEGTSVITVNYEGKTTSFNVIVTHASVPREYTTYDYSYFTGADSTSGYAESKTIHTPVFEDCSKLILDFDFMPLASRTSATSLMGGSYGNNLGNAYNCSFYYRTDTHRVSAWTHGTAAAHDGVSSIDVNSKTHVTLNPQVAGPSILTAGDKTGEFAWTSTQVIPSAIGLHGNFNSYMSAGSIYKNCAMGTLKVYDVTTNALVGQYIPCVRNSDNVIGIYDTVAKSFFTASDVSYATIGNSNCTYAVGNWEA